MVPDRRYSRTPHRTLPLLAALLVCLVLPGQARTAWGASDVDLAQYVNPFIGTDRGGPDYGIGNDGGHVFPGALFPHGMVQWSPDTTSNPGGYRYGQSTINGFSLTHFSGRGCSAYQDLPFTPTLGPLSGSPASVAFGSTFSHASETATPGYYGVHLDSTGIDVALTASPRTGFGQFTYPASTSATMLINAGGSAAGNNDSGTGLQIVGDNTVTGSASSGNFCGNNQYTIYFAARFDSHFSSFGTWNGAALSGGSRSSTGRASGAYLVFDTTQNRRVQVQVGLSFVSTANAQANLQAEAPDWDFAAARARARSAWNARLNAIQVTGGTPDERTTFYTALYHASIHPNIFSDANGQYIGFDGQVHLASGYIQYENYPGWDMYRSLIALLALLDPAETSDMLQSLVNDARQGGGGLPRWEVANDNSGGMTGDPQDAVIGTAHAFGATHFDTSGALQAMDLGASVPGTLSGRDEVRSGLGDYLAHGYVNGDAATTLEYTSDDFAIGRFAAAIGNAGLAAKYQRRATNWQNLYNSVSGYLQPRNGDGRFSSPFDPSSQNGYREGDAAQYLWFVPYNLRGLFDTLGGNDSVIRRLDTHFAQLNAGPTSQYAFMANEPEFAVPWAYDFAGAPYRTQDVVRRIETQLFHATPGGLSGNDDGGAMSSWYVFAALGIYPAIPGVAGFVIGSPLFTGATLRLGNGSTLQIDAPAAGDATPYVQTLSLNGQPYASPWLPYSAIASGATLQFALGDVPNTSWGSDPALAPPSYGDVQVPPTATATASAVATGSPTALATATPTSLAGGGLPIPFNNVGSSSDGNRGAGNFDGLGYSYSREALQAVGLAAGGTVVSNGVSFRWPDVAAGMPDNALATGQTIVLPSPVAGDKLAFLGAANHGPSSGSGQITYADGSVQPFQVRLSDWTLNGGGAQPAAGNAIVATTPYRNYANGQSEAARTYVFYADVPLVAGKVIAKVTIPNGTDQGRMHIFAASIAAGSSVPTPTASPTHPIARNADLGPFLSNRGISDDSAAGAGNFDSGGYSYSAQALRGAGIAPGTVLTLNGTSFLWPATTSAGMDNVAARGQTIPFAQPATGTTVVFLGASSTAASGTGTISYADGTTQAFSLGFSDWTLSGGQASPAYGNAIAATLPYRNYRDGRRDAHPTYLFSAAVPLQAGEVLRSVSLPDVASAGGMHIFAISVQP